MGKSKLTQVDDSGLLPAIAAVGGHWFAFKVPVNLPVLPL
jgi:hypothetical protein